MVKVVYANFLDLKNVCAYLYWKTCGIIRQKKVNRKIIVSIVKNQWISFINRYELIKVEIIKDKVSIGWYSFE